MSNKEENLYWVNALRAICIIFVYFAHSEVYTKYTILPIDRFYRPFFVNAFFFVSGYLLFRTQLSDKITQQTTREYLLLGGGRHLVVNLIYKLILPSILFAFVNYTPKKILRGESLDLTTCLLDTVGGCSLWFTSALVVAQILFLILLMFRFKSIYVYIMYAVFCSIVGVYLSNLDISILGNLNFPYFYKNGMIATLYIAFGGLFQKYETLTDSKMSRLLLVLLFLIYLLVEYCTPKSVQCMTSMNKLNFLGAFVSIIGSYLLVRFCKFIRNNNFLNFIGSHSICFYFFSGGIPIVLSATFSRYLSFLKSQDVVLFAVFLLSLLLAYTLSWLLYRYMPFLFDVRILLRRCTGK
jgi:fucose 4-O-acetylase-like acetyltransferase